MKSIRLIFGCHAHQPIGNFDFVFERAYRDAYRPFLDVLERYPTVRVTLHLTGPLFDWFEARAPEYLERLAALVSRDQVEIMGGAYYEPLICAVPERDARAQIARMQEYCRGRFGRTPRGIWLAERVWEPHMARILSEAGVEYTALDDSHFLCSGLRPEALFGHYMTEDEGKTLRVFPIQEKLRYLVPFHRVEETIDWLRDHATEDGTRCAVLHDDYEKFGVWPGTHKSVYHEGWLEAFFQALSDHADWIHCVTYEQHLQDAPAVGRTYLTCASYMEMMTWALPPDMQRDLMRVRKHLEKDESLFQACAPFLRGGFWRSYLAKYPESNNIQKRMLRASERLDRLRTDHGATPAWREAQTLLHRGQCNCAYWHGVFGGLYLNHLRTALYENLIAADAVMDRLEGRGEAFLSLETRDFDGDGHPDAILENDRLALFLNPVDGGTLFELDYKIQPFNFLNVLARRDEVYHDLLREKKVHVGQQAEGDLSIHELVKAKEAGLDRFLAYDPWRRASLRDRFFCADATPQRLWDGTQPELGDFAVGPYDMAEASGALRLSRKGTVAMERVVGVVLEKRVHLIPGASEAEVLYDIRLPHSFSASILFGVECAVNLLAGGAPDRYLWSEDRELGRPMLGTMGMIEGITHIAARDEWQRLEFGLRFSRPARVCHFPIDTVSQSEDGQERVHQGCVLLPCWPPVSENGGRFSVTLRLEIRRLDA